jgi:hypothetical protein
MRFSFAWTAPLALVLLSVGAPAQVGPGTFLRGDANLDADIDVSDAVGTLSHLFLGAPPLACDDAADSDDNGSVEITDAIRTLVHLFLGGPAPELPFPEPDRDFTLDPIDCDTTTPDLGDGPITLDDIEPWIGITLSSRSLPGGGILVPEHIFQLLASMQPGESLLDYANVPGMEEYIAQVLPRLPVIGGPVALPDNLQAPAGQDGCYRIPSALLIGKSHDTDPLEGGALESWTEPETVCGIGLHTVRFFVRDSDGHESTAAAFVTLCDSSIDGCEEATTPGAQLTSGPPCLITCEWVYSPSIRPPEFRQWAERTVYNEAGQRVDVSRRAPPLFDSRPSTTWHKLEGPGPIHGAFATRVNPLCSTPAQTTSIQVRGDLYNHLNLICYDSDGKLAYCNCKGDGEATATYQGVAHLGAYAGHRCPSGTNPVETSAVEETHFMVNGSTIFDKALVLHRGNQVTRSTMLNFGARLGVSGAGVAGDIGVNVGVSEQVVGRTGELQGTLRALGNKKVSLPMTVLLEGAGRAEVFASGQADGFAGLQTEVVSLVEIARTNCPGATAWFVSVFLGGTNEVAITEALAEIERLIENRTGLRFQVLIEGR